MKNPFKIKERISAMVSYFKWLFRPAQISFGNKPTIAQLVKDKNFSELRNYFPTFGFGKHQLTRPQSLALYGGFISLGLLLGHFTNNYALAIGVTTIAFGTAKAIVAGSFSEPSTSFLIDSTHFCVSYYNSSAYGFSVIGTISTPVLSGASFLLLMV